MSRSNGLPLEFSSSQDTIAMIEGDGPISLPTAVFDRRGTDASSLEKGKSISEVGVVKEQTPVFKSVWTEIAFVSSVFISLAMTDFFIGGFNILIPALVHPLSIPTSSQTWPSSVMTLVLGAFLFPMGRLTDMYGGYIVYNAGLAWYTLWAAIAGTSQTFVMLVTCRAMEGLGAAAILPAGFKLLGSSFSPGPKKNFIFGLYGCAGPIGFFLGTLIGGLAHQLLTWRWYFFAGAIMTLLSCFGVLLTAPRDFKEARAMNAQMDWLGVFTIIPGLMLTVYAITDSSRQPQGWLAPQIITCFVLGICFLSGAIYVEGWVANAPLIPPAIFKVKHMKRMVFSLIMTWGSFSILLFYANFYIQKVIGMSPLTTCFWFSPRAAGGLVLAAVSGLILHKVPGQFLLILTSVCEFVSVVLFALMPSKPVYWSWVFPAMIAETVLVNVNWTVSNMYLTTNLPKDKQGLAGAMSNCLLYVGNTFFLAIANVALTKFENAGKSLKEQYQSVFFIALATTCIALVTYLFMGIKSTDHGTTTPQLEDATDPLADTGAAMGTVPSKGADISEMRTLEKCLSDKDFGRKPLPNEIESDGETIYERHYESSRSSSIGKASTADYDRAWRSSGI